MSTSHIKLVWSQLIALNSFKLIPPHIYLAVVVCSWGVIASLQSLTTSFAQILLLRTLLGLGEAAFCGVPFYLSFFYRRDELAFRTGLFISAAPLATSCASTVAWLITAGASFTPIAPWRLLFLIEGFPSVLVAWYCWNNVADSPSEAWFLTKRERVLAVRRIRESGAESEMDYADEKSGSVGKPNRAVDMRDVLKALKDPKSYLTAVSFQNLETFLF
jgi:MFS family permease